jgi:hypothetical protein
MPGLHIALELNALAIDLEKHARLLPMQRGAQLVFKDGDLAEQVPDFVVHANSAEKATLPQPR